MGKSVFLGGIVFLALIFVLAGRSFSSQKETIGESSSPKEEQNSFVVLELFTSQGCSSCPAADALLEKVKNQDGKNVFALSYHVDYWNYIGWEDPFSKPEYAFKQRKYNNKFQNRSNYTPQLVVNGMEHFVGSNAQKLRGAIAKYGSLGSKNKIVLKEAIRDGDGISFSFNLMGIQDGHDLGVRALLVLNERVTKVKRGENRNRTLSNSNIVVAEKVIDSEEVLATQRLKIPDIVRHDEEFRLILVLENQELDILGATGSDWFK